MKLISILREITNSNIVDSIRNNSYFQRDYFESYQIPSNLEARYKILGYGQNGIAILDKSTGRCLKFTKNVEEMHRSKKLLAANLSTIVNVYSILDLNMPHTTRAWMIEREYCDRKISESDSDLIADNVESIYHYMSTGNAEMSNFQDYFSGTKYFDFFKQLRIDSKSVGLSAKALDIADGGIADNIGYVGQKLKLFDF